MSKYCSEDLRNAAEDVENYSGYDEDIIADMLRFAADVLERKKKCEYAVKHYADDGSEIIDALHAHSLDDAEMLAKTSGLDDTWIVRRQVGEWEKV